MAMIIHYAMGSQPYKMVGVLRELLKTHSGKALDVVRSISTKVHLNRYYDHQGGQDANNKGGVKLQQIIFGNVWGIK